MLFIFFRILGEAKFVVARSNSDEAIQGSLVVFCKGPWIASLACSQ